MQSQALVPTAGMVAQGAQLWEQHGPTRGSPCRDVRNSAVRPTIVLVHGGFVGDSAWQGVYRILREDGYIVRVVQNAMTSLGDDVAATRRVLDAVDGPVILVGHSYAGAVITEAGNDPKVIGLVYIAAFVPDKGESVSWLINDPSPCAPIPAIGAAALNGTITQPAWRQKPSWYLVAGDDKMIPPRAQWAMAKRAGSKATETGGSHAVYAAKPSVVAAIIRKAARGGVVAQYT